MIELIKVKIARTILFFISSEFLVCFLISLIGVAFYLHSLNLNFAYSIALLIIYSFVFALLLFSFSYIIFIFSSALIAWAKKYE